MSITACYDALTTTIANGVSAKSKYTGIPSAPPQRLPAVVTKWTNTGTESQAFSMSNGSTFQRSRMRRTHSFEVVVILGATGLIKDEDIAGRAAAEALLNAIDDDTELGGTAKFSQVENISQGLLEWDQQAFFTVRAVVSVMEDI